MSAFANSDICAAGVLWSQNLQNALPYFFLICLLFFLNYLLIIFYLCCPTERISRTLSVYGEVMYIFTFRFDNILKEMHIILTLAVHSFDRKINQDKLLGLLYKYSE
jgi:hypothetical protein